MITIVRQEYILQIKVSTLTNTKCFLVLSVAEDFTEYDIIVTDIDRCWNKIPRQFSDCMMELDVCCNMLVVGINSCSPVMESATPQKSTWVSLQLYVCKSN